MSEKSYIILLYRKSRPIAAVLHGFIKRYILDSTYTVQILPSGRVLESDHLHPKYKQIKQKGKETFDQGMRFSMSSAAKGFTAFSLVPVPPQIFQ